MPSILNQGYELVPVEAVQEHPENANHGDEDTIGESIEENGFFGALVVQRATGNILVGNHRYRQMLAQGADEVPVLWVDVEDARARKILLVDNASARKGQDDERALLALLDSLARGAEDPGAALRGTGYTGADYMELIERLNAGPVVPDFPGQDEPAARPDHRVEIECTASALAQFQATLDRWADVPGVTVSIT